MNQIQILKAKSLVDEITQRYGTRDPLKLCDRLGIKIFFHELIETRGCYMNPYGVPIISLAKNLDEISNQFVCAHELGHYLLDDGINRVFMDTHTYMLPDVFENRADTFGAQLLWGDPNNLELEYLTDWQIADCLNIPKCNVNERLLELGIYW